MPIRLVYIEDDPANHRFMREFAKREGYELHHAYDAESGLKMVQDLQPDIVVTDINLPDFDGDELCEILKADETTSHIPIIAFTGYSNMHGDRERLLSKGFDGYIDKPFNRAMLRITIERVTSPHE
ncbi:MAG: response regulator [Anaerolineae bacterium]|nr:response regulator [Anaerolineae bacterium]MDQ7035717.1 response regulator [Anaerolineae bacterium]